VAGKKEKESDQIRATLTGYHFWVFTRLMEADNKTQTEAIAIVMDHWLGSERKEFLEERGITRQAYNQTHGKNVVSMTGEKKKPA